jgi:hypothetical protein
MAAVMESDCELMRAALLPVRVRVDWTTPLTRAGEDQEAVTPLGRPVTEKAAPAGRVGETPPASVTLAVRVWDAVEFMESAVAERVSWTLGGAATARNTGACALSESPVAVTVRGAVPRVAEADAVRVRVEDVVAAPGEKLLVLHAAVTPEGRPVTARVTAPEKAPLVMTETGRVAVLPWTMAAVGKAERASLALPRMVIGRLRD